MPILNAQSGKIEIAPGRGDLRYSSVPSGFWPGGRRSLALVGGRTISFANIFATQTWVAAAVMRMLTWSVRVPLKAYRRIDDDNRERLRDHVLADALRNPWERGSAAQLVMSLLGPLLVHGNGLTGVLNGAGDAIAFDPFDWRCVTPINYDTSRVAGWTVVETGSERTVPADQTLHIAWWSPLGPLGISPLQQLGVTIAIEEAAQRYQRVYLAHSARPESAVSLPDGVELDPETRAELREDLDRLRLGQDQQGRPVLLPAGMKWEAVGHTAHEAELIEQRKLAREEVAALYMIPPPMLGQLDRATYANITTQREMAYTDALGPPLVLAEQVLNSQLIAGLLRENDIFVEFDFAGVLRGDRLKEIQAIRQAIGTAVLTPNEGRRVLNMPPSRSKAADELYLPSNNLTPLSQIGLAGGEGDQTNLGD